MKEAKRVGLLGGTFDPVHIGHLAVADKVKEAFLLESVWFIPAAVPPHKQFHKSGLAISAFEDRIAMLARALDNRPDFCVSRIESERPQPSYTIDTLTQLRQELGSRATFLFIIGADAFVEIATWKAYSQLPKEADFVVITRPAYQLEKIDKVVRQCFKSHRYDSRGGVWLPEDRKGGKIYFLEMEPVAVSSTEIRRMVHEGYPIQNLVPPGVEEYILEHCLYRAP